MVGSYDVTKHLVCPACTPFLCLRSRGIRVEWRACFVLIYCAGLRSFPSAICGYRLGWKPTLNNSIEEHLKWLCERIFHTRLLRPCTSLRGRVITELVTVMKPGIYKALWRDQQCINMTEPIVMVMLESNHYACLLARAVCAGARARPGTFVWVILSLESVSSPCLLLVFSSFPV